MATVVVLLRCPEVLEIAFRYINGHAQKYQLTVQGIRGVSPEEEKESYSGKDLQKGRV